MAIGLQRGVFSTFIGLSGTGAIMIWPDQWYIGAALVVLAFVILTVGIEVNGRPWWRILPKPRNPFRRGGGLYTGRIIVSDGDLDTKHYFEFSIAAFNGTAHFFQTATIEGIVHVVFIQDGTGKGGFDIRAPILYSESPKPHAPDKEFSLNSRLFLDANQAAEFRSRTASGHTTQLMLTDLTVELGTKRGKRVVLSLWDGVSLRVGGLTANRVVCLSVHSAISGKAC